MILTRFGLISLLFLCGCVPHPNLGLKEYWHTEAYFGANVTIRCFFDSHEDISPIIMRCWERLGEIQLELNAYSETGQLARINKSGFNGVPVQEETYRLLKGSLKLCRLSQGAFDITVFPLVELWKDAAAKNHLPEKEALEAAKGKVGYQKIRLQEPDLVFFDQEGMGLDLGAIVSGFACDEIAAILDASGIRNFLIDTGGEIFCRGMEAGKKPWRIGVQDPANKDRVLMVIQLRDKCVSTSGNYEKFYTIGGTKFSHIIDPKSGYPQKEVISATVIAKTGREADALSTALCVLGGKKGTDIIMSLKDVQAMVMEIKDGKAIIYKTEGFG